MNTSAGLFQHLIKRRVPSLYQAFASHVFRHPHLNVYDPGKSRNSHQFCICFPANLRPDEWRHLYTTCSCSCNAFRKRREKTGPDGAEEGGQRERTGDVGVVERNNVAHMCGCRQLLCGNLLGYFFTFGDVFSDYQLVGIKYGHSLSSTAKHHFYSRVTAVWILGFCCAFDLGSSRCIVA